MTQALGTPFDVPRRRYGRGHPNKSRCTRVRMVDLAKATIQRRLRFRLSACAGWFATRNASDFEETP